MKVGKYWELHISSLKMLIKLLGKCWIEMQNKKQMLRMWWQSIPCLKLFITVYASQVGCRYSMGCRVLCLLVWFKNSVNSVLLVIVISFRSLDVSSSFNLRLFWMVFICSVPATLKFAHGLSLFYFTMCMPPFPLLRRILALILLPMLDSCST